MLGTDQLGMLGASIQGEASGDAFGHSVAISHLEQSLLELLIGELEIEVMREYLIGMDQQFSSIKILMKHLVIIWIYVAANNPGDIIMVSGQTMVQVQAGHVRAYQNNNSSC